MINNLIILEQQHIDKFIEAINKLEKLVEEKPKQIEAPVSKTDWISLEEFYEIYKVSRTTWYEKYKKIIKYRDDGKIWVYKPSMEKYLMDKSIN